MKLKHAMISLIVAVAAGCDTLEQDADGQILSINNETAYFLPNNDGLIDLPARIVSPGKVRVEITGTTRNGSLSDLGKGLLHYSPSTGSTHDSFRFRVFSDDNSIIGEDSIGIIITNDTTSLPCAVYTRNDTVRNVTGPVTVDVAANDYACLGVLTITVNVAPAHGTATIVNNQIRYVPGTSFDGHDQVLYKAVTADPSMPAGYGWLRIYGTEDDMNCQPVTANDLFFKPLNDTTTVFLDVLQNDTLCNDSTILITLNPHYGNALADNSRRKIRYKNFTNVNNDDTLYYQVGSSSRARVIIKRQ